MFCTGRHILRDLATCTAQYTGPAPAQTTPTVTIAETNPMPGSGMK